MFLRPSQEVVLLALHDALPGHHALPLIEIDARRRIRREHRLLRLLQLQQQRRTIAVGEEAEGAERANAADAHDLERDVGQSVTVEQHAAFLRLVHLVSLERGVGDQFERVVLWRHEAVG